MSVIIKLCNSLLNKNNLKDIKLSINNEIKESMSYNIDLKEIGINVEILKNEYKQYPINYLDYVKIIFLHELGHALDNELPEIHSFEKKCSKKLQDNPSDFMLNKLLNQRKENSMQAEINAWNIAESMVDDNLKHVFGIIKADSLENHREIGELEIAKYMLLMSYRSDLKKNINNLTSE